eukprot:COSAG06_NODE_20461_length_795_cov_0.500000_2_plen_105_part_00
MFCCVLPANGQCELRVPLASETNGGFVAKKGAAPVQLGAKFKLFKPTGAGGGAFLEGPGHIQPQKGMWLVHIQGKLVAPLTWELIQHRLLSKAGVRPLELTFSG